MKRFSLLLLAVVSMNCKSLYQNRTAWTNPDAWEYEAHKEAWLLCEDPAPRKLACLHRDIKRCSWDKRPDCETGHTEWKPGSYFDSLTKKTE